MNKILETHGRYRVYVELEQNSGIYNPRTYDDTPLTNVITPTQQRYIDIDEDGGPLQYGWDYFAPRALDCLRRADAEDLFVRWAKITHGATVIVDRPHDGAWGLWYLMPDKAAETTWSPEKVINFEIQRYRDWAQGEVYAYVIERSVKWVPEEGQEFDADEPTPEPMITWETADSCGGYIGYDEAKEAALEAFAYYKESN
jgi:hypothetical protein